MPVHERPVSELGERTSDRGYLESGTTTTRRRSSCASRWMCCDRGRRWRRLAIDVFLSLTALVLIACLHFGVFPPHRRGFFCNDESISYVYTGDTVSMRNLLLVTIGVPIVYVILVETKLSKVGVDCVSAKTQGVRSCFWRTGRIVLDFVLGVIFGLLTLEMLKVTVSELRPHFLHTCQPDSLKNCSHNHKYITNYSCTSDYSKSLVLDSFKSFPSGHAAASFYAAVFLSYYTNARLKGRVSHLFCPVLQLVTFTLACCCSISRITDHRHHWWDVLFGAFMGMFICCGTIALVMEKVKEPSSSPKASETLAVNEAASQILLNTSFERRDANLTTTKDIDSNHT